MDDLTADNERIRHHVRRLSRRSPVRRVAEKIMDGKALARTDVALLVKRLDRESALKWRERMVAAWALGTVDPAGPDRHVVAAWLIRAIQQSPIALSFVRGSCVSLCGLAATVAGTVVAAAPLVAALEDRAAQPGPMPELVYPIASAQYCISIAGLITLAIIAPFTVTWSLARGNSVRARAALALGRLGAIEAIPVLARASRDSNVEFRAAGQAALVSLLAVVGEDARDSLASAATIPLTDLLDHAYVEWIAPQVVLDVLDGLDKIGDGRAVAAVQTCAHSEFAREIRERAARLVPILEERLKRAKDAAHLLRPAAAPGADTLLRPASGGEGTAPELLLRPADAPEQEAELRTKPE